VILSGSFKEICAVHSQCSRSCDQDVPIRKLMGTSCRYFQNVPLWVISGTPFWLILGFTDWEHHDCITGNTAKNSLNEPLRNIAGTFFGKIQDVPINYLMGTLQSHDLEHCECTDHSPGQGNCREIGRENSGCTQDVLGGYMLGTLSISLRCTCDVPARYTGPCPQ